jgi:endo-1,4-beta-xylanase
MQPHSTGTRAPARLVRRRGPGRLRGADRPARSRPHAAVNKQPPAWLATDVGNGTISASQVRELLYQRIQVEVGRYRGRILQWDVANELFTDPSSIPTTSESPTRALEIIADTYYDMAGEDGTNARSDTGTRPPRHPSRWSPTLTADDLPRSTTLGLKVAITEGDVRPFVNNAIDRVRTRQPGSSRGRGSPRR